MAARSRASATSGQCYGICEWRLVVDSIRVNWEPPSGEDCAGMTPGDSAPGDRGEITDASASAGVLMRRKLGAGVRSLGLSFPSAGTANAGVPATASKRKQGPENTRCSCTAGTRGRSNHRHDLAHVEQQNRSHHEWWVTSSTRPLACFDCRCSFSKDMCALRSSVAYETLEFEEY
jgi:hypothetical protein